MRLTLRTLLAYLDDTLEPAEAKLIGQKVAESDAAQELVARIREVTRRRRITTPSGPGESIDPNAIAEYLDNELTTEALAEVEQVALAFDVYLAELAACHQILTVVLGEPAKVPPTAYTRMYKLVKSPESNHRHEPPRHRETDAAVAEGREVDETLRLGIPALRSGDWTNRLILVGGATCVVLLLGVAIWMVLPNRPQNSDVAKNTGTSASTPITPVDKKEKPPTKTGVETPTKKEVDTPPKKEADAPDKTPDKVGTPDAKEKPPDIKGKEPDLKDKKVEDPILPKPITEAAPIGHFEPARDPAILLQLQADKKLPERKQWARLVRSNDQATSQVLSNSRLVSLPGYRSNIQLDSGVQLTLWGNVPEISPFPVALESVATLHMDPQFDLDLTLLRGRIALKSGKAQANVRLRFHNPADVTKGESWKITLLEKGTEVIVNLAGIMLPGEPFYPDKENPRRTGPIAVALLLVHTGSATVGPESQPGEKLVPPPAGPLLLWDSRGGQKVFET